MPQKIATITQTNYNRGQETWMVTFDWIASGKQRETRYYKSLKAAQQAAKKANRAQEG